MSSLDVKEFIETNWQDIAPHNGVQGFNIGGFLNNDIRPHLTYNDHYQVSGMSSNIGPPTGDAVRIISSAEGLVSRIP